MNNKETSIANIREKHNTLFVLTARGKQKILAEGGSQSWVLDAKRARRCQYVVCIQNRDTADDWGLASAEHHVAFIVGRLKDVVHSQEKGSENRWTLVFSEYAEISVADAWPGYRNPVFYSTLEEYGIDLGSLKFEPMPSIEASESKKEDVRPLTLAEAKEGLAAAFGVAPSDIEITIHA